jgi:hypothetical protein
MMVTSRLEPDEVLTVSFEKLAVPCRSDIMKVLCTCHEFANERMRAIALHWTAIDWNMYLSAGVCAPHRSAMKLHYAPFESINYSPAHVSKLHFFKNRIGRV